MSTTMYFIRHGSVENKQAVMYGRLPGFELSEKGRSEVEKTAKYLADKGIVAIFTSPLVRTFETANIISKQIPQATITHVYDLIETESSHWQGLPFEAVATNVYYEDFLNNPASSEVDENLNQIAARMEKVTEDILAKYKSKTVAVVSHECPILALKLKLEDKSLNTLKNYHLATAGVIKFVFEENGKLSDTQTLSI